jgi:hypothetical protein
MFSETRDLVNKAVGPHEQKRTMKMIEARKELHRLTDEASAIAQAIIRIKGQSYGEVTDENLNV